jgi:1-acyl-sn-glycerol-3-phosphate acyltransferase
MLNWVKRLRGFQPLKKILYAVVGFITYSGLTVVNKIQISGMEHLKKLPKTNVLFVSNHQTYFADVITFIHIFCAHKWRKINKLGLPYYLLNPFTNVHYIAAEETMNSSFISKILAKAGAITIKRTWREGGKDIKREIDTTDTQKIDETLSKSWVITFPQGTTKPFAPGRKGTAYIIKKNNPIVVPIVINGFWNAFGKKGLRLKEKGCMLSVCFKEPIHFDINETVDAIMEKVMDAIEQSASYMMNISNPDMNASKI